MQRWALKHDLCTSRTLLEATFFHELTKGAVMQSLRWATSLLAPVSLSVFALTATPLQAAATGSPSAEEKVLALLHVGNQAELKDVQLAESAVQSADVLNYARMLGTDHAAADTRTLSIAQALSFANLSAATLGDEGLRLQADHDSQYQVLASFTGNAFDQKFLEHEVGDHEAVLAKLDELATDLTPGSKVSVFVESVRPKLQHHLDEANRLLEALGD
jgi:putative membrane protein